MPAVLERLREAVQDLDERGRSFQVRAASLLEAERREAAEVAFDAGVEMKRIAARLQRAIRDSEG